MVKGLFAPSRPPLANYNWIDIAAATGYIIFDGKGNKLSTGDAYSLVSSTYADDLTAGSPTGNLLFTASALNTTTAWQQALDIDFDTSEFQLPRSIKGQAMVRISYLLDMTAGGNHQSYVIAKLRKLNGAESEIASAQSATYVETTDKEVGVSFPITVPNTLIKKGEKIRLTIEVWKIDTQNNNSRIYLAHHPTDVAITTPPLTAGNTRLTIAIPFRLNL